VRLRKENQNEKGFGVWIEGAYKGKNLCATCAYAERNRGHKTRPFANSREVYNSSLMDQTLEEKESARKELPVSASNASSTEGLSRVAKTSAPGGLETLETRLKTTIERLYPALNGTQRNVAAANLLRYCEIALAVTDKQSREPEDLTGSQPIPTIKERSSVHLKE